MGQVTDFLNTTIGISPANQAKILYSILIILVLAIGLIAVRRLG